MVAALASMALQEQESAPGRLMGAPVLHSPPEPGEAHPHRLPLGVPGWHGAAAAGASPPSRHGDPVQAGRQGSGQPRGCAPTMPIPALGHVNTGLSQEIRRGGGPGRWVRGCHPAEPPSSGDISLHPGQRQPPRGPGTWSWLRTGAAGPPPLPAPRTANPPLVPPCYGQGPQSEGGGQAPAAGATCAEGMLLGLLPGA